jgi:hypothetical protein
MEEKAQKGLILRISKAQINQNLKVGNVVKEEGIKTKIRIKTDLMFWTRQMKTQVCQYSHSLDQKFKTK